MEIFLNSPKRAVDYRSIAALLSCPVTWSVIRLCPFCGSNDVSGSRRYDHLEKVVLPLFLQHFTHEPD